jgi:hypothetical protein
MTPTGTQTFACEYRNMPVNFSSIWRKLKSTLAVCSTERVPKKSPACPGANPSLRDIKRPRSQPWTVCAQAVCIRSTHAPTDRRAFVLDKCTEQLIISLGSVQMCSDCSYPFYVCVCARSHIARTAHISMYSLISASPR